MRFAWLLSGFVGLMLLSSPVQAASLQFWRFDGNRNRLEFTTDSGVQPRAQLIFNPTRLVIDLPGIRLGRGSQNQLVSTPGIQSVRVGQVDTQTTRLVVELAPGYTLDPNQVKFQGASPTQWTVQLPTPVRAAVSPSPAPRPPVTPPVVNPVPPPTSTNPPGGSVTGTELEGIQVTPDGLFVRTRGSRAEVQKIERSRDRTSIHIDLRGTTISQGLNPRELAIGSKGVEQLQLTQLQNSPPVTRLTLKVNRDSPDWNAIASSSSGIVLLPQGGLARIPARGQPWPSGRQILATGGTGGNNTPTTGPVATVQSVELSGDNRQLLIRTSGQVIAASGWDRSTTGYRIILNNARITNQTRTPQLGPRSPFLRLTLNQETANTVAIVAIPASGVTLGELNQPGAQLISLQINQASSPVVTAPTPNEPIPVNVPPPSQAPVPSLPPATNPVPNSRVVVVVDPGHGGRDPGAVGIGGLQEKLVVMDISQQVAAILQQQGIQAVLTRTTDVEIDLEPRVRLARQVNATLFVSIHANAISMSRPDVNGLETYYYQSGLGLARTIHNSIVQTMGVPDRGVRQARFYVLRQTSMPAVLVETGFVTGRDDAARLANPAFRRQMAEAIARGIIQYIQQSN